MRSELTKVTDQHRRRRGPDQTEPCGGSAADPIDWQQQEVRMLRFTDGRRRAQANESAFSYTPRCGYGRDSVTWNATLTEPLNPATGSSTTTSAAPRPPT
jgi:hypothetical protein